MANGPVRLSQPERLSYPLTAYQVEILDRMLQELYERLGTTESVVNVIGTPTPPSQIIQAYEPPPIDVDSIEGLLGEIVSFRASPPPASSSLNMAVIMTRVVLGI